MEFVFMKTPIYIALSLFFNCFFAAYVFARVLVFPISVDCHLDK